MQRETTNDDGVYFFHSSASSAHGRTHLFSLNRPNGMRVTGHTMVVTHLTSVSLRNRRGPEIARHAPTFTKRYRVLSLVQEQRDRKEEKARELGRRVCHRCSRWCRALGAQVATTDRRGLMLMQLVCGGDECEGRVVVCCQM